MLGSLRTRLLAGHVLVPLAFIIAVAAGLYVFLGRYVEREIATSLARSVGTYETIAGLRARVLGEGAASIADAPHLKAVLSIPGVDSETLHATAESLVEIGEADQLLLLDPSGRVVGDALRARPIVTRLPDLDAVERAIAGERVTSMQRIDGAFYETALAPVVLDREIVGAVLLGERLEGSSLATLVELTGLRAAILLSDDTFVEARADDSTRAVAATDADTRPLGDVDAAALALAFSGEDHGHDSRHPHAVRLAGKDARAVLLPLGASGARIVLWAATDDLARAFEPLRLAILLGGSAAFVLMLVTGLTMSRRIVGPVESLRAAAERFGAGRFDTRVDVATDDELGALAEAFNRMAADIARSRDRLRAALDDAQAASRAKTEFLANMSHEIRTPMNGVIGLTELLLGQNLPSAQRDTARMIQESAHSLVAVINDILDFAKLDAGRLALATRAIPLAETVRRTFEVVGYQAIPKSLEMRIELDPSLPASVMADPDRLRQVLVNLLGNAIKFTPRGEITLRARLVDAGSERVRVRFEVEDTGIGVPPDQREAIFERFSQADSSLTRRYGGTGLGLTICREIVTLMGGEIGVEDGSVGGSAFWFEVPFEVATDAEMAAATAAQPGGEAAAAPDDADREVTGAAPPPFEGLVVLLVEDNAVNQKVACRLLERLGCTVELAENGSEAVTMTAETRYDVVFMDCQMPVLDGYEATREIRARERLANVPRDARLPIVALTAHAMPGDRERCLDAGMDDYAAKPVTAAAIAVMLETWGPSRAGAGERGAARTREDVGARERETAGARLVE